MTIDRLPARRSRAPGLAVTSVGVAVAVLLHRGVESVGVLTWAVLLGAGAANLRLLPATASPGLRLASRGLLRLGVVLLGCSLSLTALVSLGPGIIGLVVGTLVSALLTTLWLSRRVGLARARGVLLAVGTAVCGASAIVAVQRSAEADEDDVASAIAMVTLCGSAAMVTIPLLQAPLGLTDAQLGVWAGASVHEVGQVVAAAGPAGSAAVSLAVVVKLTRVLLLAPVVAVVHRVIARSRPAARGHVDRPASVPLFVLGFLGCVLVRSTGLVPPAVLDLVEHVQTLALAAGLFALGTGVRLAGLVRHGGPVLTVGVASTVFVAVLSLPLVLRLA